ncbi:MAG: hypothetical protein JWN99_1148 [Ilumatobacteraceae bacterium]|nr:hypothetical protein [Ilumatobacteraceae bacterium]
MTMIDERPVEQLDRPSPWSSASMSSAAELGRWRLAARLARREIRRRPWRTLLVVLLIGVPVAGMVVGDAGYRSSQLPHDQSHRFGTAAARVTVTGTDGMQQRVQAQLPSDATTQWGDEVSFVPLRDVAHPNTVIAADLSTMNMGRPMAAGIARLTDGRLPTADDEVFMSTDLARQFGVEVGDSITLVRPAQRFQVVGIGTADGYYRLLNAPGFDLSVLRPGVAQRVALVDGPSVRNGSLRNTAFDLGQTDASAYVEYPQIDEVDYLALFLGWVFCILLMAVLGIVVAAAFAVSGRRQLVTIGQLSASGTDPAVLRRYLALQGTWSGGVGVVAGLAAGLIIVPLMHGVIANDGRTVIAMGDIVVIAITALLTSTLAAIVPTRDLARTSVLAALGGRRPVAKVRPRQVRFGAVLIACGLVGLWLAVSSARDVNDSGGSGMGAAVALAAGGGLAVLAGMCCVCPVIVDLVARLGSHRRGSVRLAARGLGRHRARSAALMAAIAAIGAAAMAAGATAEQSFGHDQVNRYATPLDMLEISSMVPASGAPVAVDPSLLDQVQSIVGSVDWFNARQVMPGSVVHTNLLVADEGLMDVMGLTEGQRAALAEADAADINPPDVIGSTDPEFLLQNFGSMRVVSLDAAAATHREWMVITPQAVERLGLHVVPASTFGRLAVDVTRAQSDALSHLNQFSNETEYFSDVPQGELLTNVSVGYPVDDHSRAARLVILGGMLLLTTIVVGVGMALWAAEGKDERDALVSIGAPPSVLAAVVGMKAWILAMVGGLIAVPLGFGTLRWTVAAAGQHTRFPWLVAGGVVVLVPLVIGVGATVGSAVAQRVRPVKMSTLATD